MPKPLIFLAFVAFATAGIVAVALSRRDREALRQVSERVLPEPA